MSRNAERIILAFTLSFVGSIIAQQLGALWWIGLIVGFISGYIGYDVRGFVRAVPVAFHRASARPKPSTPIGERFTNFCRNIFYSTGAGISIGMTLAMAIGILNGNISAVTFIIAAMLSIAFTVVFAVCYWQNGSSPTQRDLYIELLSTIIRWMHPIPFAVRTLPICAYYALLAIAWVTEKGSEFTCRFIRHLFLLVHSHERVLFGIDVAIGVAFGHYTGNAILGGLAGAAWWIFDHHFISVKWLKIEPATR